MNKKHVKYSSKYVFLKIARRTRGLTCLCVSSGGSMQDGFMRSFQTRPTTWATDWPVTRRTTQSPTPLLSTLPCPSCLNNPTTHKRPQRPAAAAPPRPKTPSLPPRTQRPSSNTLRYRACHPHPRGSQRTLFPRSSTCELINSSLFIGLSRNVSTEEVLVSPGQ